nr:serine/threonine-protein kinase [Ktedonobacteraceae bacterium]
MLGNDNSNIGKQIGSSYRIVAELGRGGFGDVYLGQHIFFANRPPVAIKLLHTFLRSPKERDQFIQEAQLLNSLTHPHILPILDAGMHESLPFIVMEYASGGSLQDRIDQQPDQTFPVEEAITILTHIGEALHYAHQQNIVHRDLKPDNVLFNSKGEAMLADFGLAAILSSARTRDMGSGGTPAYMAPEMFEGKVSVKSDQYALGCIAYELVTGRKPFEVEGLPVIAVQYQHAKVEPTAPTQHNPRISSPIEQGILKAMAKDRANRHVDVRTFLTALQTPQKSAQEWFKEGYALDELKRYEEAI